MSKRKVIPLLSPLRFKINNSLLLLQPKLEGTHDIPTLQCDLKTGAMSVKEQNPLTDEHVVFGFLGLVKLQNGCVAVLVTGARYIASVEDKQVFRITDVQLITHEAIKKSNHDIRLASILQDALDPNSKGGQMFASHECNLCSSRQWARAGGQDPKTTHRSLAARADPKFVWNYSLLKPLMDAGADDFGLPVMVGYVGQVRDAVTTHKTDGKEVATCITLVARMSPDNAGTASWRSGLDKQANAAHFVEVEQTVELTADGKTHITSHIGVLESTPLMWTRQPTFIDQEICITADEAAQKLAFQRHAQGLLKRYQALTLVHLPSPHAGEMELTSSLEQAVQQSSESCSGLELVLCPPATWSTLAKSANLMGIWRELAGSCIRHGISSWDGETVSSRQSGVVVTSCSDPGAPASLVTFLVGHESLVGVLQSQGVLGTDEDVNKRYFELMTGVRTLWSHCMDAVSLHIHGAPDPASHHIRTGTSGGVFGWLIRAGILATRAYLSRFGDGKRQDATDLTTGAFNALQDTFENRRPSTFNALHIGLLIAAWGILQAFLCLISAEPVKLTDALMASLLPFTVGCALLYYALKVNPQHYIDQPILCPPPKQGASIPKSTHSKKED